MSSVLCFSDTYCIIFCIIFLQVRDHLPSSVIIFDHLEFESQVIVGKLTVTGYCTVKLGKKFQLVHLSGLYL